MRRRPLLPWLLAGALPLVVSQAFAQAAAPRRIGILAPGTVADPSRYPEPLLQGLHELGWVEGRNIRIERRIAADRVERLPAMADELVALGVELIVTVGTPSALAARKATATVPIVMATIGDPVAAGLVQSLARPGGNATGNTFIEPDLAAKRLQVLKELLPSATRIGELMNPDNPALQMLRAGEAEALRALVSYAPSTSAMMRNAAVFVDKILGGARPAELPVQRPTKIELIIHRRTARQLGIAIPTALLLRADEVIA